MTMRRRLDNRRPSERIEFEHGGKAGTILLGFHAEQTNDGFLVDDKPGEIFIMFDRVGSDVEAAARDGGLLLSIAMQYGIDPRVFQLSITRLDDGRAASVIGAA